MSLEYTSSRQHHWHFSSCCDCLVFIMNSSKSFQKKISSHFLECCSLFSVFCFLFSIHGLYSTYNYFALFVRSFTLPKSLLVYVFWAFFLRSISFMSLLYMSCYCCIWRFTSQPFLFHSFYYSTFAALIRECHIKSVRPKHSILNCVYCSLNNVQNVFILDLRNYAKRTNELSFGLAASMHLVNAIINYHHLFFILY